MAGNVPLIACSLEGSRQRERLGEWKALLARADSREALSTGMRYRFPAAWTEEVRALAASEQQCCAFLRFDLVRTDSSLVLTVESGPTGRDALRFIFA